MPVSSVYLSLVGFRNYGAKLQNYLETGSLLQQNITKGGRNNERTDA
jgi:hypothetical protein